MIVFLLAVMIILVLLFSSQKSSGTRAAVIKSYVILFFLIAASTEIATLFDAVTENVISLFWVVLSVILLLFFALRLLNFSHPNNFSMRTSLKAVAQYGIPERLFLMLGCGVLAATLLVAILAPPNTWDSMTYHMARVVEWIQHRNVDFYPTSIDRQNYQMPLAEFAILHLQLLSNSDRLANLVQWSSFCVAILLTSLIAKEFQASMRVQFFSALITATIPMAILQSSSTQNDVVTGTFCLGFAYFLLQLIRTFSFPNVIFCGLALGLALLTKGSAYIYCSAFGLIIGATHFILSKTWKTRWELLWKLALVVLLGLVINIGHYTRNYDLYGHPLSTKTTKYKNEEFSAVILASNLIRNAALHLGTPSPQLNLHTYRAIRSVLGDELNNPKSTWGGNRFRIPFSFHEDSAGNLFHFLLIIFSFLTITVVKMKAKSNVYCYAGSFVFAVFLYCSLLKWQLWASRLHTPLFMLSAPLVAVVLSKVPSRRNLLITFVAISLFLYSLPFLFLNRSRPLIPISGYSIMETNRLAQYFVNKPYLFRYYYAAVKVGLAEGKDEVGLYCGGDDWEYPLWVLAGRLKPEANIYFRHIGVTDISKTLKNHDVSPPALVVATKALNRNVIGGRKYVLIFKSKHICVLKLKET